LLKFAHCFGAVRKDWWGNARHGLSFGLLISIRET
jgi:hypothetical protein